MNKKIEVCYLKPSELKNTFGNPRKITKSKMDDLKKSIEKLDDFGVIVIDEGNQIISGNQRVEAMKQLGIETPVACKRLVGYKDEEKKIINLKANSTSGDWDFTSLEKWLEGINLASFDLQFDKEVMKNIKFYPENEKDDEIPEIENNIYDVQTGDIWQLGGYVECPKCHKHLH